MPDRERVRAGEPDPERARAREPERERAVDFGEALPDLELELDLERERERDADLERERDARFERTEPSCDILDCDSA